MSTTRVGSAIEAEISSASQGQNQSSSATASHTSYRSPQASQASYNTKTLRSSESRTTSHYVEEMVESHFSHSLVQESHQGSQSLPRPLTPASASASIRSQQLYSSHDNGSNPSIETTSLAIPTASQWNSSAHPPNLARPGPTLTVPSISSATSSRSNSLEGTAARPKFPRGLKPSPSTTSLGSLRSTRSTSSNSPFYFIKKPPMDLELPFGKQDADSTVDDFMKIMQERQEKKSRNPFCQYSFTFFWIFLIACVVYFLMIGFPLWDGLVYSCWKYAHSSAASKYGLLAFLLWGGLLTWLPLLFCTFERKVDDPEKRDASETCLVIPAYKAADALRDTIPHALKIFKPEQIFIIANGNSPTPLDNTEEVCKEFGVNHFWVPVGSKIVAEFVGVYLTKRYKYCLLTDDDVHLPVNLPIITDRIKGKTACIGYTIKSTGANGSKGTVFQQAQDVEYKLAGISKVFQGKYGSATFPHGAIILWNRNILEKLFFGHPGYHISEDWYFGHTCRSAGFRVEFCSQVFVETETPPRLFIPTKSNRGGYGEMTIWKQRFYRWDFFFLYRLINDIPYLLFAWRLGWYEFITKLFVFAEIYETILYLSRPFMLPIMLAADWRSTLGATFILLGVYVLGFIFFNAFHLRRKDEMIAWKILPVYFGMKMALMFVDTASVYHSLIAYAKFFSVRHSRVVENYNALEAVRLLMERRGIEGLEELEPMELESRV